MSKEILAEYGYIIAHEQDVIGAWARFISDATGAKDVAVGWAQTSSGYRLNIFKADMPGGYQVPARRFAMLLREAIESNKRFILDRMTFEVGTNDENYLAVTVKDLTVTDYLKDAYHMIALRVKSLEDISLNVWRIRESTLHDLFDNRHDHENNVQRWMMFFDHDERDAVRAIILDPAGNMISKIVPGLVANGYYHWYPEDHHGVTVIAETEEMAWGVYNEQKLDWANQVIEAIRNRRRKKTVLTGYLRLGSAN